MVVLRRPTSEADTRSHNYLPCEFCYGMVSRYNIASHVQKCLLRPKCDMADHNHVRNGIMLVMPIITQKAESNNDQEMIDLNLLLEGMKETNKNQGIPEICQNDPIIRN